MTATITAEPNISVDPAAAAASAPSVRRWSRDEYQKMGDMGFFIDQRVELFDGEIIQMSPQLATHSRATGLVEYALLPAFPRDRYWIRPQLPLGISPRHESEPDIAVIEGTPRTAGDQQPASALLVVEVSDATLRFDRGRKAGAYAGAGVADYWIVNLIDNLLEVHRDPRADTNAPGGFAYAQRRTLKRGESVAPLAMPGVEIAVADLLP